MINQRPETICQIINPHLTLANMMSKYWRSKIMTDKPKRTRPKALESSTVIKVRVSADEARRLDKIVAAGGFPSRSEAVRHWIMIESPVE
jgi:hypothetical protein